MKKKLSTASVGVITSLLFSSCGLANAVNGAFASGSDAEFYRQLELTEESISAIQNAAAQQRASMNNRRKPDFS
jgi:hypothetical protein